MSSIYFRKCDVCNKDIIAHHHNAKYCPECQKNMRRKQQIAAQKKYQEKARQEYVENIIRIRSSNARIAAIVIEAEKAGLTYGQYMARLRGDKQ